ncbi:MAG: cation diffusion facilitator family transporter [Oligoflexia bacterium]|nr:cation diffusion facilitator family transporter [Oligoflexia bacterium]
MEEKCIKCKKRVGDFYYLGMLLLTAVKYFVGIVGGSRALLYFAIHSTVSIVSATALFLMQKYFNKPIDDEHPYGHGKIEFITNGFASGISCIIALILFLRTDGMVFLSLEGKITPLSPNFSVLMVALIALLVHELGFRSLSCIKLKFGNAEKILKYFPPNRIDSLCSIVVIIGMIFTKIGFTNADNVAAILITIIMFASCFRLYSESVSNLMDRSLPSARMQLIKNVVHEVAVAELSQTDSGITFTPQKVIARLGGGGGAGEKNIWVTVNIKMHENDTMEKFNTIASKIKESIFRADEGIFHVNVEYSL